MEVSWLNTMITVYRQSSPIIVSASDSFTIASENLLRFIRPYSREADSSQKWHQIRVARHGLYSNSVSYGQLWTNWSSPIGEARIVDDLYSVNFPAFLICGKSVHE